MIVSKAGAAGFQIIASVAQDLRATPATTPKGGQFVLHTKALHGNPFDGYALGMTLVKSGYPQGS